MEHDFQVDACLVSVNFKPYSHGPNSEVDNGIELVTSSKTMKRQVGSHQYRLWPAELRPTCWQQVSVTRSPPPEGFWWDFNDWLHHCITWHQCIKKKSFELNMCSILSRMATVCPIQMALSSLFTTSSKVSQHCLTWSSRFVTALYSLNRMLC